jgi:Fur family peroxide stress response transcriptional regulator
MNNEGKSITRRKTSQRDLVLEAVCNNQHPSAGDIFAFISPKKRISFGTVYRNLQILEEEGEITSVKVIPELLHYDRRRDPHHHLHCKKCGRVFDVPVPYQADFDSDVEKKSGFHIDSHSITFEGLCNDCKSSEKNA